MRSLLPLSLAVLAATLSDPAQVRALPPGFTVEALHPGLAFPTALRFAPDGRLFYTELNTGRVMMFTSPQAATPSVWATVPVISGSERGLLGLAHHPDFPDSPYVFVFHTNPSPLVNRITRLTDQGSVGVNSMVFFDDIPTPTGFHNGGRLAFGPDGMLYATIGDGGNPANSQDPGMLLGKILRLGPGARAAPANPFGPDNPAALIGVRNPFGLCFDPRDGIGYFTENGPECDDELNLVTFGQNYGWGPADFCGGQPPGSYPALATITPPISPTGCCVYRGSTYPGYLDGHLFFTAHNTSSLHRAVFAPGSVTAIDTLEVFAALGGPAIDVTVGPDGNLWYCTSNSIGRIVSTAPVAVAPPAAPFGLQIAPNPFTDAVRLARGDGKPFGRVDVLDVVGRRVRLWARPGVAVSWNGRDEAGRPVPAGVYLVRTWSGDGEISRRIVRLGPW